MAGEVFVTGVVGIIPGSQRAQEFREAAKTANKAGMATIYILGSLFDPRTSKDDCITYLESIPGRKVLVTEMGRVTLPELSCGAWHGVCHEVALNLWGKRILLAPDPLGVEDDIDLLLHIGNRPDDEHSIRVKWEDWTDRFGPAGLNSVYALSVLADQMGAGMVAAEPTDGR